MLTGRQRNFQDVLFLVQRKGFGAGVIACLRTCVFLQLLLDLPRERTGKMGSHQTLGRLQTLTDAGRDPEVSTGDCESCAAIV